MSTKTNPQTLFNLESDLSLKYSKLNNLYSNNLEGQDSQYYGMKRQHEYSTNYTNLNFTLSQLDNKSVNTLLKYNYSYDSNNISPKNQITLSPSTQTTENLEKILPNNFRLQNMNYLNLLTLSKEFGQQHVPIQQETNLINSKNLLNEMVDSNVVDLNPSTRKHLNQGFFYKTFFTKSPNQQVLASERNVRNIDLLNPLNTNFNINTENKLNYNSTFFPLSHTPTGSKISTLVNKTYDRFTESNQNSSIMSSKEELAPSFLFTPF
jgi:hypothetical protein